VLQYVARGHTYREIGDELFIAEDGREPRAEHPAEAPPQPEAGAHPLRSITHR
jgi:hypothetical protein